jgi:hypothetical protein
MVAGDCVVGANRPSDPFRRTCVVPVHRAKMRALLSDFCVIRAAPWASRIRTVNVEGVACVLRVLSLPDHHPTVMPPR